LNWNLIGRSRVEKWFEKERFTATGRWTGRCIGRGSASPPRPVMHPPARPVIPEVFLQNL
jgi:hypothetical protein